MDKQIKTDWIIALRSEKFQQGYGYLCYNIKHCCLGVLCEVMGEPSEVDKDDPGMKHYGTNDDSSSTTLNTSLIEKLKIDRRDITRLMTMNDHEEKSFAEIADWIESHL